jgi:RES domain-containing protein
MTRLPYAADPLSGIGAARHGNRWNPRGVRMAYASEHRSLAFLEMLVHVSREAVPEDLLLVPVEVPDQFISRIETLPEGWNLLPYSEEARREGFRWVESRKSVGLLVPSVIVPQERNLLINPAHPDFPVVRLGSPEPLVVDRRLFP